MSYVRKNATKVYSTIIAIVLLAGVGFWEFYRFVTFRNGQGVLDLQGGRVHLWWAIALAVFACIAAFFVFSVFVRHDVDDELHITS